MAKQLHKLLIVVIVCAFALVGCSSKSEQPAKDRANKLVFSDVKVECTNRDGLFGGRYAKFEVTGTVKNDTNDPVNKDNMPTLESDGKDAKTYKADLSESKLLAGESCNITYKGEIDLKSNEVPALSFSCKLDVSGLEDAQKELNDGIQKVVGGYDDKDAEKKAADEKREAEEAEAKKKQEEGKKALEACKDKTAAEAKKVADGTDYKPRFNDSHGVDVTGSVNDGSDAGKAKVTLVEVKDKGLLSDASVTFTLDYEDPAAKKKREEEEAKKAEAERKAAEEKAKKEAEAALPAEYRSALRKAESYSKNMHMSKAGIYDQLVSEYGEKFSPEAAQYAIDNVQANWNENALYKARSYQEMMAMAPEAIRDQLVSEYGEKFTEEEADYAIANL